jgi:hypothetical protein
MIFVFGLSRGLRRAGAMIVCAMSIACIPTYGADPQNAQDLLAHLIQSERAVRDIQAHVKTTVDDKIWREYDWGYDRGKEFIDGYWNNPGEFGRVDCAYAFDGDKEYHYMYQTQGQKPRKTGLVTGFDPANFHFFVTPKTLMGYSVSQTRQESLGQSLSRATNLTVADRSCDVDGSRCCLIEALGIPLGSDFMTNVRVWIDEKRDYRPIKIEMYVPMKTPWERLVQRVDKIVLENVGGMWIPVSGDRESFTIKNGAKGLALKRMGVKQHIVADSMRINEGIDAQRFKINFPVGCGVLDEIVGVSYVVGGGRAVDVLADIPAQEMQSGDKSGAPTLSAVNPDTPVKSPVEPCSPGIAQQPGPAHTAGKLLSRVVRPVAWLCLAVVSLAIGLFALLCKKSIQKRD